ncbi:virulence RhuM family protein [Verminephrobacter eiseniae]|uniref:Putative DNA-binding protein n=1 Tax=Verminephrobacter eiseniae (strain EF01-2) TaxID=391735 RepID=A1WI69_VEREI|nr:virulence RhuM family protein [Verminephrobacter eiseniae]ABM57326.1 putative DNA-binding protein [Verminephrobacter eiseniae EF01-2]MCW5282955.1 hydroxyacid dehydrogenase [Verminephrobacter eiseniae]MCW5303270.1 hydroxyacid dehydrogenase [Verminephrobacter eiseniae]MCW8178143.1 hydroxyacid dehydrogenase [Verminephrobacter eiseniae]MCW8188663.1 hydroxyacid dehydrogenase [Verminephrobacter eiseniae]
MKQEGKPAPDAPGELVIYPGKDGRLCVQARLAVDTLWLTQKQMAELFGVQAPAVSKHLKNIFETGELAEAAVVSILESTAADGKAYATRFYSLDAVIAVGYRVNSVLATHFRIWATQVLREYIVKGFALDDKRLKNPPVAGSSAPDHFAELLERVRDIRASERRMYLRVREVFTLAADYQPSLPETTRFFQVMQNKLHYAVTGLTAPEIVASRINHLLPNAGLSTWAGEEVRKSDVTIAKNYLQESEIRELNRIVTMWLDFAEDQAERRKQVFMADWETRLDDFLRFNDRKVLPDAGKRTRKEADAIAHAEFEKFAERRRAEKESSGSVENIRALESAAKLLESAKPRQTRKKKGE